MTEVIRRIEAGEVPLGDLDRRLAEQSRYAGIGGNLSSRVLFVGNQRAIASRVDERGRRHCAGAPPLSKQRSGTTGTQRSPASPAAGSEGSPRCFLCCLFRECRVPARPSAATRPIWRDSDPDRRRAPSAQDRLIGQTSIAAIDRSILPSAPLDPFTGQAFHYGAYTTASS